MRSPSPAIHTAAPKRLVRRAQPELPTPSVDTAEPVRDDALSELYRTRRYDEAARVAALQVERDRTNAAAWIVLIRAHANRGDLRAADAACLAGLEHNRLNAELEYLHGVLMIEAGRTAEAAKAFRRAIYLDRTLAVAHLALGQLLSRAGSDDVARRAFRNAEQLLTALPQDAKVRAADGETAGRLLVLTRTGAAIGHGTTT